MENRDITAVFWDTQGKIKYNPQKNFFNYETSMSINWNNKLARRVLINLIQIFNKPDICNLQPNGVCIWTKSDLYKLLFYDRSLLFSEIVLRDKYVINFEETYNNQYPFLSVSYNLNLDVNIIKDKLSSLHNYIIYDSMLKYLTIKSRTLEENLILLKIFLENYNKKMTEEDLLKEKKKLLEDADKLNTEDFTYYIKNVIDNINDILLENNNFLINTNTLKYE